MDKPVDGSKTSPFENAKQMNEFGEEFWTARDLKSILQYSDFRNFREVISKAIISCQNSGYDQKQHFVEVTEMVQIGTGAKRAIRDYQLSRYACYLIIQNADPSKPMVALGQTYFAVQTRKQEIFEQGTEDEKRLLLREELRKHNTFLASAAKDAGVETSLEFAIFQNHGYRGLYGGRDQKDIHRYKKLKTSQKILDHMGSTELAANLFRATQTEEKIRRERIRGKNQANQTHYEVGKKVRQTINELGGTMPEDLPVMEDIKKVERKIRRIKGTLKRELKDE